MRDRHLCLVREPQHAQIAGFLEGLGTGGGVEFLIHLLDVRMDGDGTQQPKPMCLCSSAFALDQLLFFVQGANAT